MSLANVTNQRERDKFIEIGGETAVRVAEAESAPTASHKSNPSVVFTYSDGTVSTISQTIEGTTYTKTFTYEDGNLVAISSWES